MPTLTSLLARDAVVSLDVVERALQRQVLEGGEIDTALLEIAAVPENVMATYRAASFDLRPAARAQLEHIDGQLLGRVATNLAHEFRVLPIALEGDVLVLATDTPLQAVESERLVRTLNAPVSFRIATELRVQAALASHYGLVMPERFRALEQRLRDLGPGELCEVRSTTPSREPIAFKSRVSARSAEAGLHVPREGGIAEAVRNASVTHAPPAAQPASEQPGATQRVPPSTHAPTSPRQKRMNQQPRGPLPWQRAVELLAEAQHRDAVLEVFFAFARQYFECSVLFVVRDERLVEFRSAGLPDADEGAGKSLRYAFGGAVHGVVQRLGARVLDLRDDATDAALLEAIGRARSQPSALVPIAIRQRMIALLYGDRDGEPLSLSDFSEILPLLPNVAAAFERIIQERKRTATVGRQAEVTTAPPPASARVPQGDAPRPPRVPAELVGPAASDMAFQPTIQLASESIERGVERASKRSARIGSKTQSAAPADEARADRRDEAKTVPERPSRISDAARPAAGRSSLAPPPRTLARPSPKAGSYSMRPGAVETLRDSTIAAEAPGADADPADPGRSERQPAAAAVASTAIASDPGVPSQTRISARPAAVSEPSAKIMPSIMVAAAAGEAERLAEELSRCTPDQGQDLISALLRLGGDALGALKRRFPGQLWFDRSKPRQRMPSGQDISAIARAVRAFEDKAVPIIAELMSGSQVEARLCALLLAAERPRSELMWPVYQRLFDSDGQVRLLALEVLPRYRPLAEFGDLLKVLRERAVDEREPIPTRLSALEALGTLRDVGSLELLLAISSHRNRQLSVPAHRSLLLITAQDFGDSERKWKAWFDKNRARPRVEWLIDSLMHGDTRVRNTAGVELQKLTQVYYGFVAAGSKRDRERAQQRYRDWLRQQGRALTPA